LPAGLEFDGVDFDADDEGRVVDALLDLVDDLEDDSGAVGEIGAAVFIRSLSGVLVGWVDRGGDGAYFVRRQGQELSKQVAVRAMHLHAIEAAFLTQVRCLAPQLHHLLDLWYT